MGALMKVADDVLYQLADTLEVLVTFDRATGRIRGEGTKAVDLYGLTVNFHTRIVSSCVLPDNGILVLVRVKGNFCLLVHVPNKMKFKVTVCFVNLAKLDGVIEGWLEMRRPKTFREAQLLMKAAVVASFEKNQKNQWKPLQV